MCVRGEFVGEGMGLGWWFPWRWSHWEGGFFFCANPLPTENSFVCSGFEKPAIVWKLLLSCADVRKNCKLGSSVGIQYIQCYARVRCLDPSNQNLNYPCSYSSRYCRPIQNF